MKLLPNRINHRLKFFLVMMLFLAAASILYIANLSYVQDIPVDNLFLHQWVTTRLFILEGISPYQNGVSRDIGDSILKDFNQDGNDLDSFVYPLYKTYIFIPFATLGNFEIAHVLWVTFQQIFMISVVIISLDIVKWRIKVWLLPILFIFSLLSFQNLQGILSGNVVVIISLFFVSCFRNIRDGNFLSAGFFLALTTIRPKLAVIIVIFILFWAITRRNWSLVGWFFFWLLLLIGTGMLFIPDWLLQNIRALVGNGWNLSEGGLGSIYIAWLPGIGNQLRWLTIIGISLLLVIEWWLASSKDFRHFLWTVGLTLTLSNLIGFSSNIGDVVLLIIPLILVLSIIDNRYHHWGIYAVILLILLVFSISWALAIFYPDSVGRISSLALMNIPVSLIILIGLYWIRWWTIRPPIKLQ